MGARGGHADLDAEVISFAALAHGALQVGVMQRGANADRTARVPAGRVDSPDVALVLVDRLPLEGYHAFHATRAELLRRLGRGEEAREAYDRATELAGNTAEAALPHPPPQPARRAGRAVAWIL